MPARIIWTGAPERNRAMEGAIAQLVEHRTENPGVPGSIPGGTTKKEQIPQSTALWDFSFYENLSKACFCKGLSEMKNMAP